MKKKIFDIRKPVHHGAKLCLALAVGFVALGIWSALTYTGMVPKLILPYPHSVITAFSTLFVERELHLHILWSFIRITSGFFLAMAVALPLGIVMGSFPFVKHAIEPFTGPLRYLPIAALIPLFLVWFGMGELMKIMFLFVGIIVYMLPLVIQAVEEVDHVYLETAYTLKATRWQTITQVLLPGALPMIFEGFRVMNGIGWTYVTLAEVLNAPYGLGKLITIFQKRSITEQIFASVIVILFIGYFADLALVSLNKMLFSWREGSKTK